MTSDTQDGRGRDGRLAAGESPTSPPGSSSPFLTGLQGDREEVLTLPASPRLLLNTPGKGGRRGDQAGGSEVSVSSRRDPKFLANWQATPEF